MTPIACFDQRKAANQALITLKNQGIEGHWTYKTDHERSVYVVAAPESRAESAATVVDQLAAREPTVDKRAIHCPACGSLHIEYPSRPHQSLSAAFVEQVAELAGMKDRSFFCHDCESTWTTEANEKTRKEAMKNKQDYIKSYEAKLEDYNAKIAKLRSRLAVLEGDAAVTAASTMTKVEIARDSAASKLKELRTASDSAWQDVKVGAELVWEDLNELCESAAGRFDKLTGRKD